MKAKLKRHMMDVHSYSEARAISVVLHDRYQGNNNIDQGHGRTTKSGNKDYHILKRCPFEPCTVVRQRLGPHLTKIHGVEPGSDDYKALLKKAKPWKGLATKEDVKQVRSLVRREMIRESLAENEEKIIPVFTNHSASKVYIPESKKDFGLHPFQEGTTASLDAANIVSNDEVLENFRKFMTSLDGGDLVKKSADLYVQQLRCVLESLDSEDFTVIFDKTQMKNSFLNVQSDNPKYNYAASTKQKYLTALIHFCDFVVQNFSELNILRFTKDDVLTIKMLFISWRKSLNKKVQLQQSLKAEDALDSLITPEQVAIWESSLCKRTAIKLLGSFSSTDPPILTQSTYCQIRDYFFVEIEIQNSHRSGVSSNVLVEDVQASKTVEIEGTMLRVIKIKKHKTLRSFGHARLYLQEHVFQNLLIFIRHIRSRIPGNDPHVFVTYTGRSMTSGEISTQLNSIWQRSEVYGSDTKPPNNISCTQFRKSISTLILEHNPEVGQPVADLLAHGTATQGKYYDVRRRDKSSAIGAFNVGKMFRSQVTSAVDTTHVKQESSEDTKISPTDETSSPSRRKWSIPEIKEIQSLFSDLITTAEKFSLSDVSKVGEKFVVLKDIPIKKIYDKIRSLRRHKVVLPRTLALPVGETSTATKVHSYLESNSFTACPINNEEDSDKDYVPPTLSSCTSGNEKKFCQEKSELLKVLLGSIIQNGPRTARAISQKLDETTEGKELLMAYGIDALVNRAKYERKLWVREMEK